MATAKVAHQLPSRGLIVIENADSWDDVTVRKLANETGLPVVALPAGEKLHLMDVSMLREIGLRPIKYHSHDQSAEAKKRPATIRNKRSDRRFDSFDGLGNRDRQLLIDLDLPMRVYNILSDNGIDALTQLLQFNERQLLNLEGFGPVALDALKRRLVKRGLKLDGLPRSRRNGRGGRSNG